jgi:hypothetical protein
MIVRFSASAFFKGWPALLFPPLNGCFIPLPRPLDGLLHTVMELTQQTATMGWMVPHVKLLVNELCCPPRGPNLLSKAEDLCPLVEQSRHLRQLLSPKLRFSPLATRPRNASFPCSRPTLTHWLTAPAVTPSAKAMSFCFHTRSYNSHALNRRHSFMSPACSSILLIPLV